MNTDPQVETFESDDVFDKQLYSRKRRLVKVIAELTRIDSDQMSTKRPITVSRKREIRALIDNVGVSRDPARSADMIALAKLCLIFKYHGGRSRTISQTAYDVAFFYIVKKTAIEFKNDILVMRDLKLLSKEVDGTDGLDFDLSLGGFEPRFLYGEEPNDEERQYLERIADEVTSKFLEQQNSNSGN
ncbi:MAG: hypothetical protein IPK58_23980 [Acidobacteria bacterium]|nr:hypothetical protein [Acidobacteriota bacterium]